MPPRKGLKTSGGRQKPAKSRSDDTREDSLETTSSIPVPNDMFPPYNVTAPKPLTETEKAQVAAYRMLRDRIHEGPLYTVLGDNAAATKQRGSSAVKDPFDGVETYSQRYRMRKRTLPKLDTRSYSLKFFPKELWSTLDPSLSSSKAADKKSNKKLQDVSERLEKLVAEEADAAAAGGEKNDAGEEDGEDARPDPDEEQAEEMVDDTYETDEDDMEGDYNAEAYFDDGGDDAGDDYDAGDGGEEAYF